MRRLLIPAALVAIAVAGFVAIAPPVDDVVTERQRRPDSDSAVAQARAEYQARNDSAIALSRALEAAVALEAARGIRRSSAPTEFSADPEISAIVRTEFAKVAEAQFASMGTAKVPVRVVLAAMDEVGAGYRHVAVLPERAGEPCVSVLQIDPDRQVERPAANDRLAGICGFYARYGLPGRGVLSWIDSTYSLSFSLDVVPPARPRDRRRLERLVGEYVALAPATAACLAGRDEVCGVAISGSDWTIVPRSRLLETQGNERVLRSSPWAPNWAPSSYIARLRDHVGDEAFTRIWASDATPPLAYEQVTGESFAVFARPLLLEELHPHQPGPLHAGLPLALSLTVGALCAAWAIGRTRRERS